MSRAASTPPCATCGSPASERAGVAAEARTGDLALLSMTEAADAFAAGEVTASALVAACLARIEAHDGKLNAVIRLEQAAAEAAAAAADAARAAGRPLGPLAGVPMMHKDMYYRAGKVSTCGSPDPPRLRAAVDRDRAGAAGCRRRDRHGHAEHGGIRPEPNRPQRPFRRLPQPLEPRLLHRRLLLRLRRRGGGAAYSMPRWARIPAARSGCRRRSAASPG